jgi:hypothetical protein
MRLISAILSAGLIVASVFARQTQSSRLLHSVVMTLPPGIDIERCRAAFSVDGHSQKFIPGATTRDHSFEISTLNSEGVLATSLRIAVLCTAYRPELREYSPRQSPPPQRVDLQPLRPTTIPFHGKIVGLTLSADPLIVEANYYPWWLCEFFGQADCGMSGYYVASARLERDGRFFMLVPAILRDIATRGLTYPGDLEFVVGDERGVGRVFSLQPTDSASGFVREQTAYPNEQVFHAEATGRSLPSESGSLATGGNRDWRIQAALDRVLSDVDRCGWWERDFNQCAH